jgi:hypothetical protein
VDGLPDKRLIEEIANYSNMLSNANFKVCTYLVANILFENSNKNGFLVSSNGDVVFISFNETYSSAKKLWSQNIKIPIVHYCKVHLEIDGDDSLAVANSGNK